MSMSVETFSDHVEPVLATATRITCDNPHEQEIGALIAETDALHTGLRQRLGAAVQPADIIGGGSAVSRARFSNDAYWHIGPPDTASLELERWATLDGQAVRVAAQYDGAAGLAAEIADHQDGKRPWFRLGSEKGRVKRLAGIALSRGGLVVREFAASEFDTADDPESVMDRVRVDRYDVDDNVAGLTTELTRNTASVLATPLQNTTPSIRIGGLGGLRHVGDLFYTMPGLRSVDLRADIEEISDGERFPNPPTDLGRELAYQHAIHSRLHELTVVTNALRRAAAVLDGGDRIQPKGRLLAQPVSVPYVLA